MAIAHNSTTPLSATGDPVSILSHTVTGTDPVLVVKIAVRGTSVTVSSVTWDPGDTAQVLTLLDTDVNGEARSYIFYRANPTATTANIDIDLSGSSRVVAAASTYTGVDQTSPFRVAATVTNNGDDDTPNVTVIGALDTEMIVDSLCQVSSGPDGASGNQTDERHNAAETGGGTDTRGASQDVLLSANSNEVMSWSMSGFDNWAIVAGALQEPGSSSSSSRSSSSSSQSSSSSLSSSSSSESSSSSSRSSSSSSSSQSSSSSRSSSSSSSSSSGSSSSSSRSSSSSSQSSSSRSSSSSSSSKSSSSSSSSRSSSSSSGSSSSSSSSKSSSSSSSSQSSSSSSRSSSSSSRSSSSSSQSSSSSSQSSSSSSRSSSSSSSSSSSRSSSSSSSSQSSSSSSAGVESFVPKPFSDSEVYVLQLFGPSSPADCVADRAFAPFEDFIWGTYIRFTSTSPTYPGSFWRGTISGSEQIAVELDVNGDINLLDSNGSIVGTAYNPLTPNTWHRLELRWKPSSVADADLWIDGQPEISVTGQDFANTSGDVTMEFCGNAGTILFIGSFYNFRGGASTADFLGEYEVIGPYQKDSYPYATPDFGDDLSTGVWDDAANRPANPDIITYDGIAEGGITTIGGTRTGPDTDTRIDGDDNIRAGKWVFDVGYIGTYPILKYGKTSEPYSDVDNTTNLTATGQDIDWIVSDDKSDAGPVPVSNELFQQGFGELGSGTTEISEIWSFILHTPDPSSSSSSQSSSSSSKSSSSSSQSSSSSRSSSSSSQSSSSSSSSQSSSSSSSSQSSSSSSRSSSSSSSSQSSSSSSSSQSSSSSSSSQSSSSSSRSSSSSSRSSSSSSSSQSSSSSSSSQSSSSSSSSQSSSSSSRSSSSSSSSQSSSSSSSSRSSSSSSRSSSSSSQSSSSSSRSGISSSSSRSSSGGDVGGASILHDVLLGGPRLIISMTRK